MADLPKVICEDCMKKVEVDEIVVGNGTTYASRFARLRCHDVEWLIEGSKLWGYENSAKLQTAFTGTLVLQNLLNEAVIGTAETRRLELNGLKEATEQLRKMLVYRRAALSQGVAPHKIPQGQIDEITDALLLYRDDSPKK